MSDPRDLLPDSSELLKLHRRLVDLDPTVPADLCEAVLEPLVLWLREHNPRIDTHLCSEAAEEAILSLIRNPATYRPAVSDLPAYLRMSAQHDLQNLLRRERKHQKHRYSLNRVELSADAGKYFGRGDDPSLPLQVAELQQAKLDSIPLSVRQGLTVAEARALTLLLRKERKTAAYAEALAITHLPLADQRKEVKRVKDRLTKRLERAEGER